MSDLFERLLKAAAAREDAEDEEADDVEADDEEADDEDEEEVVVEVEEVIEINQNEGIEMREMTIGIVAEISPQVK